MAELYSVLIRGDIFAARSSFFAVGNFRSKLEVVDAVARLNLRKENLENWKELYRRLDGHRRTRNSLAHFAVVVRGDLRTKHVYYLEPTWFDPGRIGLSDPIRYNFENVKNLGFEYDKTTMAIRVFTDRCRAQLQPLDHV